MSDNTAEIGDRIARQLTGLPEAELKSMLVKLAAPILAELRRRGCEFSVGTDGIDGASHPNSSTTVGTAKGMLGNIVHTRGDD